MAFQYNRCAYNEGRYESSFLDTCCPDYSDTQPSSQEWQCGTVEETHWQERVVEQNSWDKQRFKTAKCFNAGWSNPIPTAQRTRRRA